MRRRYAIGIALLLCCSIPAAVGQEEQEQVPAAEYHDEEATEPAADEGAGAPAEAEPEEDPIDTYFGRYHPRHPTGRCCSGLDCLEKDGGKYAFVTTVRTPEYMELFLELHCSLQKTNPGIPIILLAVEGDLPEETVRELEQYAEYRLVEDIVQENEYNPRYGKNWVKLRAWEWEDYDALIMLDTDLVVLGDLTHVFSLPTDFAWAPMQGHSGWNWNRGGFIMLRPCRGTFKSMMQHMRADEHLQYKKRWAEQSFLSWFFRYTGFELPMKYNLNFEFLVDGLTSGGEEPVIIHFADTKPFNSRPEYREWPYLCWQPAHWKEEGGSEVVGSI